MLRTDMVLLVWLLSQSYFMHTTKQITGDDPLGVERNYGTNSGIL